jgi:hypothetical protein
MQAKPFFKTLTADFGRWVQDALGRAVKSAIVTFSSMTAAAPLFSNAESVSIYQRAAIAGIGAGISTLISLAGKWAGDPGSASFRLTPQPINPVPPAIPQDPPMGYR